jgi:ABC-type branched-subunit amino acid transport system ATPase component
MEVVVLNLIQSVLIMNKEEIVFRGTLEDLREHPEVIEKYLEV